MNWTIILSYVGLLIFFKAFYMLVVGFFFIISNSITTSVKYLRIVASSFLVWLLVSYIWKWINGSAMPVLAFSILFFLFSIQFALPQSIEARSHARSEIIGLGMSMIYAFAAMGINWY